MLCGRPSGALLENRMNRKIISIFLTGIIFLFSCNAKSGEPDLNYLLPTESKYMTLLDTGSKEMLVSKCSAEFKKVEQPDVFTIKDLKKYFAYEEKIGKDEFIWFISPVFDKGVSVPRHQIILLRKENDTYKMLSKYYSQIIWGEIHLCLQFTNILIVKGEDKAKGFIIFDNRADIKFKTSNVNDGYTIERCKEQAVGHSIGNYYRFNDEPADYSLMKEFYFYPSEEWSSINIEASDYLWDEKAPLKYALCNAFDENPATSFVENTDEDLIDISFNGFGKEYSNKVQVKIINGYAANQELYNDNNRIITMLAKGYTPNYIENKMEPLPAIELVFEDKILNLQKKDFNFNNRIGYFTFSVSKIQNGNRYNDTCLAEFNVFSNEDSWLFGDMNE